MSSKQRQTGLTMIELMIVVTIAAILAGIAAPSFSEFINNTRLNSTMSQLTNDLKHARSEAIKRNRRVLVCARGTNTACAASTSWQNGWLVCYDVDQDGACDATSVTDPNPIVVHQAINARLFLWRTDGNVNPNPAPITTLTIGTPKTTPIYFNSNGTQGAGGSVALTLSGNWTGVVANVATIAATGNLSKTP